MRSNMFDSASKNSDSSIPVKCDGEGEREREVANELAVLFLRSFLALTSFLQGDDWNLFDIILLYFKSTPSYLPLLVTWLFHSAQFVITIFIFIETIPFLYLLLSSWMIRAKKILPPKSNFNDPNHEWTHRRYLVTAKYSLYEPTSPWSPWNVRLISMCQR